MRILRRLLLVRLHRWIGIALSAFLIVVAATGCIIAFNDELDTWLNPELYRVDALAASLDPFVLRELVERHMAPACAIDSVQLYHDPGRSTIYTCADGIGEPQFEGDSLSPEQIFVDPYRGRVLGTRKWGTASLHRKDIMPFVNRIHFSLALGSFGSYLLGIVAIAWTLDCFVGLYLTLPPRRRSVAVAPLHAKSWWRRWMPSWQIRGTAGITKRNYDLHRAFGLWTWVILLMMAWSSVCFNLPEIYNPITETLLGFRSPAAVPTGGLVTKGARLSWHQAHQVGLTLMNLQTRANHITVEREDSLTLDRRRGIYRYVVKSGFDRSIWAGTSVDFDAESGKLIEANGPGVAGERFGDVLTRWLVWLHMAAVFGMTMKLVITCLGLVIVLLSITGIWLWLQKRRAKRRAAERKNIEM